MIQKNENCIKDSVTLTKGLKKDTFFTQNWMTCLMPVRQGNDSLPDSKAGTERERK